MKVRYILFILLFVSAYCDAQLSKTPNKHFVIAFDYALPNAYSDILVSQKMLESINNVLTESGYNGETDYVSFIKYGFNSGSFNAFIRPVFDTSEKELLWCQFASDASILKNIRLQRADCNYSFQSGAKQFAIQKVGVNHNKRTNETYLLMVTDEKVNGTDNDYKNEWENIFGNRATQQAVENRVYDQIREVDDLFTFRLQDKRKKLLDKATKYKIVFYSVEPRNRPSLFSVLDLPGQLPLKRVRGGYRLNLDVHETTSDYKLEKIEIFVNKYASEATYSSSDGHLDTKIMSKYLSNGDSITLKAWIRYEDGVYNATVLNPYSLEFNRGLTLKQQVRLKDDASILGFVPLYDFMWWWFPNDIVSAVSIWNVIFILSFIGLIYWIIRMFIRRNAVYEPANSEIKMKKI